MRRWEQDEPIKSDVILNHHLQKQGWKIIRSWNYEIRDNIDYYSNKITKILMD